MRRIRPAGIEEEPSSPGITFRLSTNPVAGPRGAPNGRSTSFSASLKTNRSPPRSMQTRFGASPPTIASRIEGESQWGLQGASRSGGAQVPGPREIALNAALCSPVAHGQRRRICRTGSRAAGKSAIPLGLSVGGPLPGARGPRAAGKSGASREHGRRGRTQARRGAGSGEERRGQWGRVPRA